MITIMNLTHKNKRLGFFTLLLQSTLWRDALKYVQLGPDIAPVHSGGKQSQSLMPKQSDSKADKVTISEGKDVSDRFKIVSSSTFSGNNFL